MKIAAHSETMTTEQAGAMMAFISAAFREAPDAVVSRGGPRLKQPPRLWVNGELFTVTESAVEGKGRAAGPVAVVISDNGESASLSFVPSRGRKVLVGLKRP